MVRIPIDDQPNFNDLARAQADELGIEWARKVIADDGLQLSLATRPEVARILRDTDRKRRFLRAYLLLAARLLEEAHGIEGAAVYAVWQLNEITGYRVLQDVFVGEALARDYIEAHRDGFDDTSLYIKPSRLTPA